MRRGRDLLTGGLLVVGSFNQLAVLESGAGATKLASSIHSAPPGLGGLDELERHGDAGRAGAGPWLTQVRSGTCEGKDPESCLIEGCMLFGRQPAPHVDKVVRVPAEIRALTSPASTVFAVLAPSLSSASPPTAPMNARF
jgi:hypothetical protein